MSELGPQVEVDVADSAMIDDAAAAVAGDLSVLRVDLVSSDERG